MTIVRHIRRSHPWMTLKRFLDGLNTLRIPDGTTISPRSLVPVSRSMQHMPCVTCYALSESQMISSIASFRRDVDRMRWMEQPTIRRWTSRRLFHFLALEPAELRLRLYLFLADLAAHRRVMQFK